MCRCIRHLKSIPDAMAVLPLQAIQEVMPPVFCVEESPQTLSTAAFPFPLNVAPMPPMIVTEKGESLDEFILRRHPDFMTSMQVRCAQCAVRSVVRMALRCEHVLGQLRCCRAKLASHALQYYVPAS
jgi:hypothetical protein